MTEENEIKRKGNTKEQPKDSKTSKSSKKESDKVRLSNRIDLKKIKTIVGVLLALLAIYLFLSFISYLFNWQEDQDRVMNKGLFEFLFEDNDEPVVNWLGKFGAWSSHLFMYRWFGISSFGFCLLFFISGFKIALNIRILPIVKTYGITLVFIVWSSIFLGFFANGNNYLGGAFGYQTNQWLKLTLGSFGTFVLILALLYISIVSVLNPDFGKLADFFKKEESAPDEDVAEEMLSDDNELLDINAVNTIKEHQIKEDDIAETVHFDQEDESDLSDEEIDNSFEVKFTTTEEKETPIEIESDDDFSVAVAQEEESVAEDELDKLRQEFGEYDPTLDLSSYVLPPIELLNDYGGKGISVNKAELEENKNRIVETLANYKIDIDKIKATVGPTVTLYEIVPAPGVRISKIKNLEDDIALSLSALGIRIIAPIPGKGTIGIEVPNSNPDMVSMRALIASEKFQNMDAELPVVVGKTITNETYTFDLTKTPHLLVAGATGQGKSVGLNAILVSLLYKKHPAQVKFVLVDPKKVELTLYNKIERHFLAKLPGEEDAIITDTSKVVNTLNSLCIEMDDRYELLKDAQCRTIKEYNAKFIQRKLNPEKGHRYLPYIVVLIDEFADLIMTAGKEVEHPIARIAQLARAIGIHLIVATQRPSVNVITGMIKANFPARIAFRVLSKIDSRTILDASGADQLIGRGDMLISLGSDLVRLQCGFVDTPEVEKICEFIGEQRAYPEAMLLPEYVGEGGESSGDFDSDELDALFADAARIVVSTQQGSASMLQRKLKLGYNRAGRLVDQLEGMGIIGAFQGSKAREVLYTDLVQLEEFLASKGLV
ncbi:MAG: DNA translocase FtsK [Crocinitomicaceae bacterium]|nr:DNA translocase FtsK [Crocinitomicaceae bacterium]